MESLAAADRNDQSSRNDAGLSHLRIAYALRDIDPRRALPHGNRAVELLDVSSPQNTEFRANARIAVGDAFRALREFPQAERSLRDADGVLKVRGSGMESMLDLAWARLEAARGQREAAAAWFNHAIKIDEGIVAERATPANAWWLARTLELAAAAMPDSAPVFHQRVADIWSDQDRRYPNHPWIEQRLAEARSRIASR